jgi:hypothetical protein
MKIYNLATQLGNVSSVSVKSGHYPEVPFSKQILFVTVIEGPTKVSVSYSVKVVCRIGP